MTEQINPFHILSGQVVVTEGATYYFIGPGNWMVDGEPVIEQLHRTDGPAVKYADGTKMWYLNGQQHRTDGPAVEHMDGYRAWYLNGQLHRLDGPAVEHMDGYRAWYLNGKRHRLEGPVLMGRLPNAPTSSSSGT